MLDAVVLAATRVKDVPGVGSGLDDDVGQAEGVECPLCSFAILSRAAAEKLQRKGKSDGEHEHKGSVHGSSFCCERFSATVRRTSSFSSLANFSKIAKGVLGLLATATRTSASSSLARCAKIAGGE